MRGTALAAGGAAAGALAWGTLVERRMYVLRRATAPVLPAGCSDIRVLHLSDMHMAPWQRGKQEWIRSLARLEPDLVVDTGDNLGHARGIEGVEYALEPFRGVPGVFVHGSNDYFGPAWKNPLKYFSTRIRHVRTTATLDTRGLELALTDLGWRNLNNAAAEIEVHGVNLEFLGVNDPHRHFDRLEVLTAAIDELRETTEFEAEEKDPAGIPALTIGVAHAPYRRVLDTFVTHGARMIFAGHTHGGQVCLPGYGALVTNCDIPRTQASGLSRWTHAGRTAYLNVSAGLGTSIYAPVRFACRPEATLLTLTPGA